VFTDAPTTGDVVDADAVDALVLGTWRGNAAEDAAEEPGGGIVGRG
jgi:hypothetical protein